MTRILLLSIGLMFVGFTLFAQNPHAGYDKTLADSPGADAYGMKSYIFVMLKTGPSEIADKSERAEIFKGHLSNIDRMSKEGVLIMVIYT